MKLSTSSNVLLLLLSIHIIFQYVHAYSLQHDRELTNRIRMESDMFDDTSSSIEELDSIEKTLPTTPNKRHSDSAEKYFDWASKTNRPMEYLRGKRFWLFTRKDEQLHNHEAIPNGGTSPGSFSQGIWRSGIVGRRRR